MVAASRAVLEFDAKRYFVGGKPHEFMVMMYKFIEEAGERVPAVRHVDGTARPQTVDNVDNPVWRISSSRSKTSPGRP